MKKITYSVKLLGIALPIAVIVCLVVLTAVAEIPQVGPLPDLMAYVIELAPRTLIPLAAFGGACVVMNITGMNIPNDERVALMNRAAAGDRGAQIVLGMESVSWLVVIWLVLWAFLSQG